MECPPTFRYVAVDAKKREELMIKFRQAIISLLNGVGEGAKTVA
jgi:hypothetical protein